MASSFDFTCKNCEKRRVGCHSVCEDYIKIKKLKAKEKKVADKRREEERVFEDFKINCIRKVNRRLSS